MQLTRCNPRHNLIHRQGDFSRLFDDFFAPSTVNENGWKTNGLMPSVDIFERDNTIIISAELPGLGKDDINIEVKGKVLTLSGERKDEEEIKKENSYRRERRYGKYERSFSMGFEIDPESVEAKYEKGVLTLQIPRPQEQQKKQIQIQ